MKSPNVYCHQDFRIFLLSFVCVSVLLMHFWFIVKFPKKWLNKDEPITPSFI